MTKQPKDGGAAFDLAQMTTQQKLNADRLGLATTALNIAKTEIIRLTARVADLEGALGVVNDDYYFYQLDSETMFAVEQALFPHTEETKA